MDNAGANPIRHELKTWPNIRGDARQLQEA